MKKTILTMAAVVLATATVPQAVAGDREWATAGKVLTGVVAGSLLCRALEPAPVYAAPPVTYVTPAPIVVQPAPVIVQQTAPVVVQPAPVVAPAPVVQTVPVVVTQPVYVQPAPVYVQPVPVYCPPRPIVSFHFGFGPYRHHHHGRW